jgi:hypothetical protein
MYYSGYNRLFCGIIFVIFNLNFGPVNLLPDFLGYIIILSGLNLLEEQNYLFAKGKVPTSILILLSVKDLVNLGNEVMRSSLSVWRIGYMLIDSVESILSMFLIYFICKGIYEVALSRGVEELSEKAVLTFRWYIAFAVVFLFYQPFSLNLSENIKKFMIFPTFINVIVLIGVAALFRNARNVLSD